MNVQLFVPCFIDHLYPQVAFNTIKVLEKAGCTVHYNPQQTCCGQPAFNAGFRGEARDVCSKFIDDFKGDSYIVGPSGSCTGFVKNYFKELFKDNKKLGEANDVAGRIFELSHFLVHKLNYTDFGATLNMKATYHDSCAALRECGVKTEPRLLLSHVKGLELVEMQDNETCCGFGGTFAVKFEPISVAMADQKIDDASATGADVVISTDMSCLMHIEGRARFNRNGLKFMHLADVLASGW